MRSFIINGTTFNRSFIVDCWNSVSKLQGFTPCTKTDLAQARIKVERTEYSSTPEGVVVSSPGHIGTVINYKLLRAFALTGRRFMRSTGGRARKGMPVDLLLCKDGQMRFVGTKDTR